MGSSIALFCELALPNKYDEERNIQSTFFHLRKIHLVSQVHCIIPISGEIAGTDIVMSIECNNSLMDTLRARDQVRFGFLRYLTSSAGDH